MPEIKKEQLRLDKQTKLDAVDRRILAALSKDARMTVNKLAETVGLSASPCWTRLKRLESEGVIQGYVAVLDHRALGLTDIVLIEVTLERHDGKVLEKFGDALSKLPEVLEAYLVTGEYDYLVKVAVAGTADYERFLREGLYRIEGIRHSRSTFALRTLKRSVSVDPILLGAA